MRIVSLCPSLTELVFDLGRGADLVGVTNYCVHPRGKVEALERIGGTKDPKIARIVALRPDVVLINEEENRRADFEALSAARVRCHNTFPKSAWDTAAMVRAIGLELQCDDAAERIARDIELRADRVLCSSAGKREVTWAYLIWRKPYMTVNRDTFADALLSLAGGRNVFAELATRYAEITAQELAAAAPERVFLCTEPFPFEAAHADELARETKLPRASFVIADGEYLSWHGSRTPAGIDYAESLLGAARGG